MRARLFYPGSSYQGIVSWDKDSVLAVTDTVGFGGTLWLLYLAGNTDVGIGKTSDFHTQKSSVRSYAKDQNLNDPGVPVVKEGYQNLCGKTVVDADENAGTILRQDKPEIVRLTPLGKSLLQTIDSDDRIEICVKEAIGIESEQEDPWWPGKGPLDSSPVKLYTYADRSALDQSEAEIQAHATFPCPYCEEEIENDFQLTLQEGIIVDGWGQKVDATCESCGNDFLHSAADPYTRPEPK